MYHYLGTPPRNEDLPYYVSASAFAEQMEFLHAHGFSSITLDHKSGD